MKAVLFGLIEKQSFSFSLSLRSQGRTYRCGPFEQFVWNLNDIEKNDRYRENARHTNRTIRIYFMLNTRVYARRFCEFCTSDFRFEIVHRSCIYGEFNRNFTQPSRLHMVVNQLISHLIYNILNNINLVESRGIH